MNVTITPDTSSVYIGDLNGKKFTLANIKEDNGGSIGIMLGDPERAIGFLESLIEKVKEEASK